MREGLLAAFASGRLTVPVDSVYPLAQAAEAYARLGSAGKLGKVILRMD